MMNEEQVINEKIQYNTLSQDFSLFSLLKFAFPSIIMMIFMGLYTIGDTILVSRFVNTNALSAINIVCPVINIIVGIGTMLATGANAIIAKKMGEGKTKRAQQDFTLIIMVGVIIGVIITIIGVVFINNIIWGLGASDKLFPYCKKYLLVLLLFTPAAMMQVLFQNLIITAGKPGFGMILSLVAGIINIILDYIFMKFFNMGISGSALGTGIGYIIPTVVGIIFFFGNKGTLKFHKPIIDFKVIGKSCFNGLSEMIGQIATAVTTFLFNIIMIKLLGEDGVAALTIIIYTQFLLTSLYIGFSMGVSPIISYNYGSNNNIRLKKIFKFCLVFIGAVSIVTFIFTTIFSSSLVSIFSAKGSEVYKIARVGFLIFPISLLFSGLNIFTSAMFTAFSNGKISAFISFMRTFGFITIGVLVLPIYFEVIGIWLTIPLAEILTAILSIRFIVYYRKKYHYL